MQHRQPCGLASIRVRNAAAHRCSASEMTRPAAAPDQNPALLRSGNAVPWRRSGSEMQLLAAAQHRKQCGPPPPETNGAAASAAQHQKRCSVPPPRTRNTAMCCHSGSETLRPGAAQHQKRRGLPPPDQSSFRAQGMQHRQPMRPGAAEDRNAAAHCCSAAETSEPLRPATAQDPKRRRLTPLRIRSAAAWSRLASGMRQPAAPDPIKLQGWPGPATSTVNAAP